MDFNNLFYMLLFRKVLNGWIDVWVNKVDKYVYINIFWIFNIFELKEVVVLEISLIF